jgi:hypothetical protein
LNKYLRGSASDIAGVTILLYIALVDLAKFNFDWDTLAYHIPFAALRVGLLSSDQFVLPPNLEVRYSSFPPLVDYVQGALWAVTGRPEATSLISPVGAFLLALYMRMAYKLPMFWTVCIFLAVPILHTALDSGYVDLWTNAFFVIHIFAAWRVLTSQHPTWKDALIANVSLTIAVNSKEQFFIVGAVSFTIIIVILCCELLVKWKRGDAPNFFLLIIFVVFAPLTFFSPIRNLILFHNPIYPITVQVGGFRLPGTETGLWPGPAALSHVPQAIRYVLSQLDLDATNMRPHGYTIDQGDVPEGAAGFRMGGALSILLLSCLGLIVPGLAKVRPHRGEVAAIIGAAALLIFVSIFPESNELRYFSFVEIAIILTTICVLREGAARRDLYLSGTYYSARVIIISAAIYTSFITGFFHLWASQIDKTDAILSQSGTQAELDAALQQSNVVCYARNDQYAILYSSLFQPKGNAKSYRLVSSGQPSACPDGSALIK